jgi:hypothetical protein
VSDNADAFKTLGQLNQEHEDEVKKQALVQ